MDENSSEETFSAAAGDNEYAAAADEIEAFDNAIECHHDTSHRS